MDSPLLIELNRKLDKILGNKPPENLNKDQAIREKVRNILKRQKLKIVLKTQQ